jgi:4-amino-4-deoxy-L-arabinose transferase-like glycosyltransferase
MLALLALAILFWDLGKARLADWDEAIYAQISKEILQNHNWLTLYWGHEHWFEKPPLFMWGTAVLFRIFGINETAARAASAVCGIALVLLTYSIGRRLYTAQIGLFSALILLTSIQFVRASRFGTTDLVLCLCIYLSLYSYIRVRTGADSWWFLLWIATALGVMVKGPAALIGIIVIAFDLTFNGEFKARCRTTDFWLGALCACLIALPWHVLMTATYGRAFIDQYFWYHIVDRVVSDLEGQHTNSLYYAKILVHGFLPWLLFLPFAFVFAIREDFRGNSRARILMLAAGIVLGFYTAVQTRFSWYILPCYPALAIINAAYIAQLGKRYKYVLTMFFGVVSVAYCATFYFAAVRFVPEDPVVSLVNQRKQQERARDNTTLYLATRRSTVATPAALFYSNRRSLEIAHLPDDLQLLTEKARANGHVDAIVEKSLVPEISAHLFIHELDSKDQMVYVEIKSKD